MSSTGQTLYRRARKVMPGGTQLLSKRPEMFLPEQWPTYFKSAKGAEVTALDGKTYLDMSYCGIGATILGFADPDVDAAAAAGEPALRAEFGDRLPVVLLDGAEHSYWEVDEPQLRADVS